jgi:hypothetical protein
VTRSLVDQQSVLHSAAMNLGLTICVGRPGVSLGVRFWHIPDQPISAGEVCSRRQSRPI